MFHEILIRVIGTKTITVENYRNLLDYKDDHILIQGKQESVKLTGKDFRIDYFTQDTMRVTGSLEKIDFHVIDSK